MIDSYKETRVLIAPSGEIVLGLPIYADQQGALFNEKDMQQLIGMKLTMGLYEKLGYLIHHPKQQFTIFMNSIDQFEDLGEL
jgi:hypothetical protein